MKEILYRAAKGSDWPFVMKTWRKSSLRIKGLRNTRFANALEQTVLDHVQAGALLVVACPDDEIDSILGFACFYQEPFRLLFIYAKELYRDLGIGQDLLALALDGRDPGQVQPEFPTAYARWVIRETQRSKTP